MKQALQSLLIHQWGVSWEKPGRLHPLSPGWLPPFPTQKTDDGQHDTLFPCVNSHYRTSASRKKNQKLKRDRAENKGEIANPLSQETVEMTKTQREGKLLGWTFSSLVCPGSVSTASRKSNSINISLIIHHVHHSSISSKLKIIKMVNTYWK